MLTAEQRTQILPFWAGLVSIVAIYFLTANAWKAVLIGAFVGGSAMLGYGRGVLTGSFAIAVLAIAVTLGFPPPDQWLQLIEEVRGAIFRPRALG